MRMEVCSDLRGIVHPYSETQGLTAPADIGWGSSNNLLPIMRSIDCVHLKLLWKVSIPNTESITEIFVIEANDDYQESQFRTQARSYNTIVAIESTMSKEMNLFLPR